MDIEIMFSLPEEIFGRIRETWKKYGMVDDEMIDKVRTTLRNWMSKAPFGIKIEKENLETIKGICWKICVNKNQDEILYFLEEYKNEKVFISPYRSLIRKIKKIDFLGKPRSFRPQPINVHNIYRAVPC